MLDVENSPDSLSQIKDATSEEKAFIERKPVRVIKSSGIDVPENGLEMLQWNTRIEVFENFQGAIQGLDSEEISSYGLDEAINEALIEEASVKQDDERFFYVKGVAINATTTSNLHKYPAEELESAAHTLTTKPIQIDHSKSTLDNVGTVIVSSYEDMDALGGRVTYVGRIRRSSPVAEMVQLGDIHTVSIGARAKMIECSICGNDMRGCSHHIGKTYEVDDQPQRAIAIGRGLTFRELSLTPFPADEHATTGIASESINEAMYTLVESCKETDFVPELETKKGEKTVTEDNITTELETKMAEMQKQLDVQSVEMEAANGQVQKYKEKEKADLVEGIVGIEFEMGSITEATRNTRIVELSTTDIEALRIQETTLKRVLASFPKSEPVAESGSKSVADGAVLQSVVSSKFEYPVSEVKEALRDKFRFRTPSEYAQRTVQEWNLDPANPNYHHYRTRTRKNLQKVVN